MINSVMSQGLYGLQKSQGAMYVSAQEIAKAGQVTSTEIPMSKNENSRELSTSIVDLKQQQQLFNASAKIIAAANNTMGSLLDATV